MDIMSFESNYPAFRYNKNAIADFNARLMLDKPDEEVPAVIDALMTKAYNYRGTRLYDKFQLATNKIEP
jgi:phosphatidylinositol kinase/protein kinase (PI-3  family)